MRKFRQKTVLVFLSSGEDFPMQMFAGVRAVAESEGWSLQTVELELDRKGNVALAVSPVSSDVRGLIDFWRPDGCIVEVGRNVEAISRIDFGRCPVVFLDHCPGTVPRNVSCVTCDNVHIAMSAAKELMRSGFGDYAFVPWIKDTDWSKERQAAFERIVRMNGKRFHLFPYPPRFRREDSLVNAFMPWVKSLPRPCGIMAVNDEIARSLVFACNECGIGIPQEVAIVGVDDIMHVCENTRPTITSVRRGFPAAGAMAARLLAKKMASPRKLAPSCQYESCGVTRRESTCFVKARDSRIIKAVEFIRRHACEGISPGDVAADIGCSRRLLDMRFGAATGSTVLEAIHEVRLDKAKTLLREGRAETWLLPELCGYASIADLRRVFKKRVGCTIGEFRRRNQIASPAVLHMV